MYKIRRTYSMIRKLKEKRMDSIIESHEAEARLLFLTGQSIASGCSAANVNLYLNAGPSGLALRQLINTTIPEVGATLMMLIASRQQDDDESVRVAKTLQRYGARIDQPDSGRNGSTPLIVAADFGKACFLQWLVDHGARIDARNRMSPTLPIYLSCQNNHPECAAILAGAAITQNKVHTLNAKSMYGNTPGMQAMERGLVECMGVLAMGGADLRQVFAMYWVPPSYDSEENAPTTDPDPLIEPQWSLSQALLSFTSLQCANCQTISSTDLNRCSRCHMAHYCSRECQKQNWKMHKHCCKRLRRGQDMVNTDPDALPMPESEPFGFNLRFEGDDYKSKNADDPDGSSDPDRPVWEYNAGSRGFADWRRYPVRIEESIESLLQLGSERYMYRPGNVDAEGFYEQRRSLRAPPNVATNYIYFCDMLERDYYSGSVRAVRRNGSREPTE